MSVRLWLFYSDLGTKQWAQSVWAHVDQHSSTTQQTAAHLENSLCVLLCNCPALHCASWISGSFFSPSDWWAPSTHSRTHNKHIAVFVNVFCFCGLCSVGLQAMLAPRSPLRCCLLRTFLLCHTCQGDKRVKNRGFSSCILAFVHLFIISRLHCFTVAADLLLWTKPLEILSSNDGSAEPRRIPCNLLVTETQRTSIHETLINKTCTKGGVRLGE